MAAETTATGRSEAGVRALVELLVADPALARVAAVEIRAAGAPGRERYEQAIAGFAKLIARVSGGSEAKAPAAAPRFVVGAIASTIEAEVAEGRTARLENLMPDLVFTALAPCVGSEQAAKEAQRLAQRAGPRASS